MLYLSRPETSAASSAFRMHVGEVRKETEQVTGTEDAHTHPDRKAGIQKLSHSHAQTKSSKNQYCNPPNLLCGGLCGLENSRVCCSPTAVGVSEDDVLSPHTAFLLALYLNTRSSLQL